MVYKRKHKITKNKFKKNIYIKVWDKLLDKNGSWIGYNAHFETPPIFPHGITSIFISGGAKLDTGCVIFQQVTIGSNSLSDSNKKGAPVIGKNCYIGAGAKIIGNVKVGDNCRIGANAVVFKDVPDNCVVVIDGMRVIEKIGMDNRHYTYGVNGKYGYFAETDKFIEV